MAFGDRNIHLGDEGDDVLEFEQFLLSQGFDPGPLDGKWGAQTNAAVAAWKASVGLPGGGDLARTGIGSTSWPYITGDLVGQTYQEPGSEPVDASPPDEPMGSTPEAPGVLGGGTLTRVAREGAEDLYVMAYEWPAGSGEFVAWQFSSLEQVEATFGAQWWTSVSYQNRNEEWYNTQVQVLSSADEIIGVSGDFNTFISTATRQAAQAAGITDPTILGQIAGDPDWQRIITKGALGNWTEEQIVAELRQTTLWQDVLYPGITSFYGQTSEPEAAWARYAQSVEEGLNALGYGRDTDGSYRTVIGDMLDRGIDDDLFLDAVPTFIRAEQSTQYRGVLDQWTQLELGKSVAFEDWFDLLAGEAAPDIMGVFEKARLQYAANVAGVGVDLDLIRRIAADTDFSEAQAGQIFNEAERNLIALGDEGLGRYGLTVEELVSASAGISTPSGRSIEEVRLMAAKAAREIGLADDVTTELFVGFSERGTPERPGLKALSPERA